MDIREASDEDLIEALANRGIKLIRTFSDTELNNELSRRRHLVEQRYKNLVGGD